MSFDDDGAFDDPDDEDREVRIGLLARFAEAVLAVPLFVRIGESPSKRDLKIATRYCSALGFPHAEVVPVEDFETAAGAAESLDLQSDAWEAAEQLRAGLVAGAASALGEDLLAGSIQEFMSYVAPAVRHAAALAATDAGIADEVLINSAAGAALKACHNAALVLLAGESEDHALALEYQLFEAGRWPVALTGQTLHLF